MWPGNTESIDEALPVLLVMLKMNCLGFLVSVFLQSYQSSAAFVAERKHVDSIVRLSSTMALKCVYPTNASISQMTWQKEENEKKRIIAVFRLPYDLYIESNYKARVQVTNLTSNNKSLVFNNTSEADVGFYQCSFHTFPYGIWEKRIHVVQSGPFELPDLSKYHVTTEPGQNVTFTYRNDSDVAVNQVTWERVQPDCIDFIIQCADSEMPIYGSDYENRVDCSSERNSSIVLWHVTPSDSGMYRYSYNKVNGENGTGWIKLTINSHVPMITMLHMILFFGIAAFLMLAITVILSRRKRKRIKMMRDHVASRRQLPYQHKNCADHSSANASQNPSSTETEEPIYVNCKQMKQICSEDVQYMFLVLYLSFQKHC
ncbi:CD226 antigen [Python bivittatus]|uniref:CD226 antigen n=1 Tax=Python bivittatus TaxID=176946 RepID=A0A9F2WG59_PYTBI|nr:CD226 antigen [Python bivittatus]